MCSGIGNGSSWIISGGSNVWGISNQHNWHNLVVVKSSNSINYYIDGLLLRSQLITPTLNIGSFNLFFGSSTNAVGVNCHETFKGKIDDMGIWDRALSADEISKIFAGQGF